MSAISKVFDQEDGVLVAYLMGGDPDPATCQRAVAAVVRGGADILELGIPFSDPIADGKSIQAGGVRALAGGTRPLDVLDIAYKAKREHGVPIAIMTYYNVVYSKGLGYFMEKARERGVDGMVVPDMPLDESATFSAAARRAGLDTILLAAPTTTPARMKSLVKNTSGFLYLVSVLGVTGARPELNLSTVELVGRAKRYTRGEVPLAVGFGISKPEHVREVVQAGADGVVVGSALVDMAYGDRSDEGMERLSAYVRSLKAAASDRANSQQRRHGRQP